MKKQYIKPQQKDVHIELQSITADSNDNRRSHGGSSKSYDASETSIWSNMSDDDLNEADAE